MRISFANILVIVICLLCTTNLQAQYIGSVTCFNAAERASGKAYPYNQSIFSSNATEADWWENLVEELDYSGMDFSALLCRGYSPTRTAIDAGDPRKISNMITAMERRGKNFKLAVFDDCPAGWTAASNYDKGGSYNTTPLFDCSDPANYKYIWDYNLKLAIQNISDSRRFKIDNRMVLIFWSVKPVWMSNIGNGNLKKIVLYIRAQCQATFGFNPYLIVDKSWLDNDPACNDLNLIDGVHDWFSSAGNRSWSLRSWNNIKTGVVAPGFGYPANPPYIDPNHGQTLINGLQNTVKSGALLTLCEGFTDAAESAAYWRSKDVTFYDYPNQRLNILRRYGNKAYTDNMIVEAEACDFFNDLSVGNSGNAFRSGDIDLVKTDDTNGGWQVSNTQANEWLEWKELPLLANTNFMLRYSSKEAASVQFSVDGTTLTKIDLPVTNGEWSTVNAGTTVFPSNSLHTVRLTIITGTPEINYFTIRSASTTGTGTGFNQAGKSGFEIYPNPASSAAILYFRPEQAGNISFYIYNANGVCIKSLKRNVSGNGQQQIDISVSDLKPGAYFVRYLTDGCKQTKKLIVK